MNPKKPQHDKAVSSGISLSPQLKRQVRALALKKGLKLSAFASQVFTELVNEDAANGSSKKGQTHGA